jgi:transposase
MGGVAREIAYDNLAAAVAEHDVRLVRFHPRFLGFAREYGFVPYACNPASDARNACLAPSDNWIR